MSGEREYEVEKILDHAITAENYLYYLVKWMGYDDPTWEPEDHLKNCPDAIEDYSYSLKQKRRQRRQQEKKVRIIFNLLIYFFICVWGTLMLILIHYLVI